MSDETQEDNPLQTGKEKPKMKIPETGEQTQITPEVKEIANGIKGEGVVAAMNIAEHIKSMGVIEDSGEPDFTRTASEVLEDNQYNGCNEAGVVLAALLRAKGFPATYIQTLKKDAVKNYSADRPSLNGHVFVEVDFGDEGGENKKIINSTTGEITETLPEDMMVGAKGLDSWDIGLREGFKDLQKLFEEKQQSGSGRLRELEQTGDYVFHGSDKKLARLEPRQSVTFDEKAGQSVPDGKPAVSTTPFADIGIFRSLISSHRAKEKGISHFSSFNVKDGEPNFSATKESLDLAREPGVTGYVHVFSKEGFEKRDDMEWRSKTAVEPIEIIEVRGSDLPEGIQIVNSSKYHSS